MSPKGGHNRKSDEEKRLSGTYRKDRREGTKRPPRSAAERLAKAKGYTLDEVAKLYRALPSAETAVAPVESIGPAPRSLPHAARQVWEKLRPELEARGTYRGQRMLLENVCRAQARLEDPNLGEARYTGLLAQVARMTNTLMGLDAPAPSATPAPAGTAPMASPTAQFPDLLPGDTPPHRWGETALSADPVKRRREYLAALRFRYGDETADKAAREPPNNVWLGSGSPDSEGQARAIRTAKMTRIKNGTRPGDPTAPDTFRDEAGRIHRSGEPLEAAKPSLKAVH